MCIYRYVATIILCSSHHYTFTLFNSTVMLMTTCSAKSTCICSLMREGMGKKRERENVEEGGGRRENGGRERKNFLKHTCILARVANEP